MQRKTESRRGCRPNGRRSRLLSRDELLARAREVAFEHGDELTLRQFERETGISQHQVYRHWRSWNDVRRGLDLSPQVPHPGRIPGDQLMAWLHEAVTRLGKFPSQQDFPREVGVAESTYRHHFGVRDDIIRAYRRWLADRNGEQRRRAEWDRHRNPSQCFAHDRSRRDILDLYNHWASLKVGFDLRSSDFKERAEVPWEMDVLVVYEHDWSACPVPVIEIANLLPRGSVHEPDPE